MKNLDEIKELNEINSKLRSGDHKLIADMVGCTSDYVRMVLNPENPRKSKNVLKATHQVLKNREGLLKKWSK